jgi:hypothetical protein
VLAACSSRAAEQQTSAAVRSGDVVRKYSFKLFCYVRSQRSVRARRPRAYLYNSLHMIFRHCDNICPLSVTSCVLLL